MDFAPGLSRSGGAKHQTPVRIIAAELRLSWHHASSRRTTGDTRCAPSFNPPSASRSQRCARRCSCCGPTSAFGGLSRAADHADRALGRGRRHRRGGAHPRHADGEGSRPAGQRGQPHRRLRRRRPPGHLGRAPDGYTIGTDHGRDRHDAPPGSHRAEGTSYTPIALVNADPAGVQVRADAPYKNRQRPARGDQGQPGQVQGLGHRPGRHLAPGDRRPAARPEDRPGGPALGAVQRRRAGTERPRRRRRRGGALLAARSARADRSRQGQEPGGHGSAAGGAVSRRCRR